MEDDSPQQRPTLMTDRTLVRPFKPNDWPDLYEYLIIPETTTFEPEYPSDKDGCKRLASMFADSDEFWAVCLKDGGKVIGHIHCGLKEPKQFGNWNLGFVFHPSYQGKGYACESSLAVMRYAFQTLQVRRFESGCNVDNPRSWHLLERLGFRREAHHIKADYIRKDPNNNPIFVDSFVYAILRDEWLERNRSGD